MIMRFFLVLAVFLNSLTCSAVNVSANASNLNKALANSSRVYPQVGSATPKSSLKLGSYQIGDFAQGGVVIWVTADGQHGLVASIVNLTGAGAAPTLEWSSSFLNTQAINDAPLPKSYTNPIPKDNYSGWQNQAVIQSGFDWYDDYPAFFVCNCYQGGGYTDWFLPSVTELRQIYSERATVDIVSTQNGGDALIQGGVYWSSVDYANASPITNTRAWYFWFDYSNPPSGHPDADQKDSSHYVRCVRAF